MVHCFFCRHELFDRLSECSLGDPWHKLGAKATSCGSGNRPIDLLHLCPYSNRPVRFCSCSCCLDFLWQFSEATHSQHYLYDQDICRQAAHKFYKGLRYGQSNVNGCRRQSYSSGYCPAAAAVSLVIRPPVPFPCWSTTCHDAEKQSVGQILTRESLYS